MMCGGSQHDKPMDVTLVNPKPWLPKPIPMLQKACERKNTVQCELIHWVQASYLPVGHYSQSLEALKECAGLARRFRW